jgi:hypothetical protein
VIARQSGPPSKVPIDDELSFLPQLVKVWVPETWIFGCSAVGDAGDVPRTETQRFMSLLQRDLVYARARVYV